MADTSTANLLDPFALSRIEDFNLLGRMVAEGVHAGLHKSIHHGRGTEFSSTGAIRRGKT